MLFTYLKIILLQYFQFLAINSIQTDHSVSLRSIFCAFPNSHIFLVDSVHYLRDSQVLFLGKNNFKNGSHDIIHTFKNYFTIVFSFFSFQ